jgi:hypothetical protein
MNRLADARVFLEKDRRESCGSKARTCIQPRGAAAHNDDVVHWRHSTPYNLRPRTSHRP